jgi:hypothetical protein
MRHFLFGASHVDSLDLNHKRRTLLCSPRAEGSNQQRTAHPSGDALGANGEGDLLTQEHGRMRKHSPAQVGQESDGPTSTQRADNLCRGTSVTAMDDIEVTGDPMSIDDGIESGVVAFAHDHCGTDPELPDRGWQQLEGTEMRADEDDAAAFVEGLAKYRPRRARYLDDVERSKRAPSQQQASREILTRICKHAADVRSGVDVGKNAAYVVERRRTRAPEQKISEAANDATEAEQCARRHPIAARERRADRVSDQCIFRALQQRPRSALSHVRRIALRQCCHRGRADTKRADEARLVR